MNKNNNSEERDGETGYSYFGARYYDSDLSGLFLSVDPMSDKYPEISPYAYCAWNPVKLVDTDGIEVNPIFGTDGILLGSDDKGYGGRAIVMDQEVYYAELAKTKNGIISHDIAEAKGTYLDEYGKGIKISYKTWFKLLLRGGDKMSSYVRNKSSNIIYYKPETDIGKYKNDGAYPLEGGLDLYMKVDGIKTPKTGDGNVIKVPTGFAVEVEADGNINIVNLPFEKILGYGEVKKPDSSWTNLDRSTE